LGPYTGQLPLYHPQAPWLFRGLFLKGGRGEEGKGKGEKAGKGRGGREFVLLLGRKKRKVGAYDQHQTPNTMHKLTLAIQRKQYSKSQTKL